MSLFTAYEERPPFCQAVGIWFDTIDQIAAYYGQDRRYEVTTKRHRDGLTLTIHCLQQTDKELLGLTVEDRDLTIELPFAAMDPDTKFRRQVLIYGHPPGLDDYEEFHRRYREAKELP